MATSSNHTEQKEKILPEPYSAVWMQLVTWIWEVVLTLLPLLFLGKFIMVVIIPLANNTLALSSAALMADGRQAVEPGRTIDTVQKFGPTLFPIVFGAVIGRFIDWFALWKASRGQSLGYAT